MRVLTVEESAAVSGGGFVDDVMNSARVGGEVGAIAGYIVRGTVAGATRGGLSGAALGFVFGASFAAGTWLYSAICD
jgi:hypothetical protein